MPSRGWGRRLTGRAGRRGRFKDQIYDVFKFLPSKVQVGLFSATMPTEVLEITKHFMRDPVRWAPPTPAGAAASRRERTNAWARCRGARACGRART